jgi:hypothetical protein
MSMNELDLVALRIDLPSRSLVAGDVGTVVHVYPGAVAMEVEFVVADGRTVAVETLRAEDIAPVAGAQILHVRTLSLA